MGGSGFVLFETKNFKWMAHENHSGEHQTYRFTVERKIDGVEGRPRESRMSHRTDVETELFDDAYEEAEKEAGQRFYFFKLEEDKKTLTQIYSELFTLRGEVEHLRRIKKQHDELLTKLREAMR